MDGNEPEIRFGADVSEDLRAGAQRAVAGMAEMAQRRADELAAMRAEREAARAALIRDAPAPTSADEELRRSFETVRETLTASRRNAGGQSVAFELRLGKGISVKGLPYDYDWHWQAPNSKSPEASVPDRAGGLMHIQGESANGDDLVNAACGIGFVVTSSVRALVEVRPYVTYSWGYLNGASGLFSHAESEGGVNTSAWLGDGTCVSQPGCVKTARLFRDRVSPGEIHNHSSDGTVWTEDITIDFRIESGTPLFVNVGAWIVCDNTPGVPTPPNTWGSATVKAHTKWVVIERFISG